MSQIKRIFKNMSWLLISQIIAGICGFVWTILMARYMGVEKFGILGFAVSITGMLSILFDLGVGTHIVRHIATDHNSAPKYVGNAIPLKSLFSIVGFILILITLIIMNVDELTLTITLLFTIEQIIKKFIDLMNATFQAFEAGKYQGISNSILHLILLVFILISIYTDLGIYGITISYILANLIVLIYEYYILNKQFVKPKFEFDKNFCKHITIAALPFAVTAILYTLYYSIDIVMIEHMVGNYAVGIYNSVYKLISIFTLLFSVYTSVIFPIMSKYFKNDEKMLPTSYNKSIKYLMLIMIPLATAITFYSVDIMQFIYGQEYIMGSTILSILIWTVCLLFISGAGNLLLNASHKELTVTKIYLIAAIFNICLNFFIIPYWSYTGAAIATILSDLLIVLVQCYVIYKLGHKPNKKFYYDLAKIIIGSGILGIALYFLQLNMWVALPVGIVIYFATVYLLKIFDNDDKYVIKEILSKN